MSWNYKPEETYWMAEKDYYNEGEVRYDIKPVKYIYPDRCDGKHWVTTLMYPTGEFGSKTHGLLLQSLVEHHLKMVDGEWLFLTKEDAERAEAMEKRFKKLEDELGHKAFASLESTRKEG